MTLQILVQAAGVAIIRTSQFRSATIADHMPYQSLEEFERAMRGGE